MTIGPVLALALESGCRLSHAGQAMYPATRGRKAVSSTKWQYYLLKKRKRQRTLELIFSCPVSGSLPWMDIEALFQELGGDVSERAGGRDSGVTP